MDRGKRAVGIGGDDRGGVELFAIRAGPCLPHTGESKRRGCAVFAAFGAHEIGMLRAGRGGARRPVIKTVGWNETTAAAEGGGGVRLFGDGVAPGVWSERGRVLRP